MNFLIKKYKNKKKVVYKQYIYYMVYVVNFYIILYYIVYTECNRLIMQAKKLKRKCAINFRFSYYMFSYMLGLGDKKKCVK